MVKVAPSLLAGNFADMTASVRLAEKVGADYLHCDVMDGMFVPNITFGFQMIHDLREITQIPLDVHLMIEAPERYIERFAEAGAALITFHVEATPHVQRTLQLIHDCGVRGGVALNPATPLEYVKYVMDDLDMVLLMSVNPGYGSQSFIPSSLEKIRALRRMIAGTGRVIDVEVDGGVSSRNAEEVISAGANVIVEGSAFFGAADPAREMQSIRSMGAADE